jgi:LacI family transcriptional regulator
MSPLLALTGTVDGMIVLDRVLSADDEVELGRRIPLVLLAGKGDSNSALTIRVDNEQAMRSLADHLVSVHQVKSVGFVSGLDDSPDSVARAHSFKTAAEEMGATLRDVDSLKADWTSGGGEAAMRARMMLDDRLPEVFACANDQTAVGVIFALKAAGLSVPEDIMVTGFDDITLTRYFHPPLTTIRQSGSLLGEVAVDALLGTIDGNEKIQRTVVLPTELIVRGSCGCVSSTDPLPDLFEVVARHLEVD